MNRRDIKRRHEKAIIESFLEFYNGNCRTCFYVLRQPDPPDAIIASGPLRKWVEHCDAYRTAVEAKTDYESTANQSGIIVEPDSVLAYAVVSVVKKKFAKTSYAKVYSRFGGGILLISARDPLFSDTTLKRILQQVRSEKKALGGLGYFDEVYLTWNSTNNFVKIWPKIDKIQAEKYTILAARYHSEKARAWRDITAKL